MKPILVRCSCGRQTTLHWTGKRMISYDPEWSVAWSNGVIQGWTCGREGHRQIALDQMQEPKQHNLTGAKL